MCLQSRVILLGGFWNSINIKYFMVRDGISIQHWEIFNTRVINRGKR